VGCGHVLVAAAAAAAGVQATLVKR
jgi:hypothetical protein